MGSLICHVQGKADISCTSHFITFLLLFYNILTLFSDRSVTGPFLHGLHVSIELGRVGGSAPLSLV